MGYPYSLNKLSPEYIPNIPIDLNLTNINYKQMARITKFERN